MQQLAIDWVPGFILVLDTFQPLPDLRKSLNTFHPLPDLRKSLLSKQTVLALNSRLQMPE